MRVHADVPVNARAASLLHPATSGMARVSA
jgi:hypothetical protein